LDRYSDQAFQGMMPDSGASTVSTAGRQQFLALQRMDPKVQLNTSRKGEERVRFGDGEPVESLGVVTINTPFGMVDFHVMETATPFLLCLKDMDRLGVHFNNVENTLVSKDGSLRVPTRRKWGHAWFFPQGSFDVFLTEAELRRVHKRFGHPSIQRLRALLERAGHEVKADTIALINKFCHYCQTKGSAPQRFKFKIKDEIDFNHEIVVDVVAIGGRQALHVVDTATTFQAAKFLQSMSAKDTWEALKQCWIDTYLGPPDVVSHDAGTNFDSTEFRAEAKLAGITCHQVPVEAHWSIGKTERYHTVLRRAFDIIKAEAHGSMTDEACLQAAVSAINNTAGPNGLVPTLLVFGALPRITTDSPPSASQQQRARAVAKAMKEIRSI